MTNDITFIAAVYKVQTLVDGGVRVTLDLPETAIMQMAQLAECQRFGVVLNIHCLAMEINNALEERPKRKSRWQETKDPTADRST